MKLDISVLSTAMNTVTEYRMVIVVARSGGMGVVHKNLTIEEQAEQIRRVKRAQSGVISGPVTIDSRRGDKVLRGDRESPCCRCECGYSGKPARRNRGGPRRDDNIRGRKYKSYRGMGSLAAMKGFKIVTRRDLRIVAIMRKRKIVALQFHPEVHHTQFGEKLLDNFLSRIAKLKKDWKMDIVLEDLLDEVKGRVGDDRVIGALSDGVDSTVAAVLVARAVEDKFLGIFVDHGPLRKDERESVERVLKRLGVKFKTVDASELFFERLKGIADPEERRKVIGKTFVEVFEKEAKSWGAKWLLQGTIYSDVVESGTGRSRKMKSHHNVGGLPEEMNLEVLEPLRYLIQGRDQGARTGARHIQGDPLQAPFPGSWPCSEDPGGSDKGERRR